MVISYVHTISVFIGLGSALSLSLLQFFSDLTDRLHLEFFRPTYIVSVEQEAVRKHEYTTLTPFSLVFILDELLAG